MPKKATLIGIVIFACLPWLAATVQAQKLPEYTVPRAGATLVQPGTTVAIRLGEVLELQSIQNDLFIVEGTVSGVHSGRAVLSDDQRTTIFIPDVPFSLGEKVNVTLKPGLRSITHQSLGGIAFSFQIKSSSVTLSPEQTAKLLSKELNIKASQSGVATPQTVPGLLTVPSELPVYTVTVAANGTADGDVFIAPFSLGSGRSPALMMLDNSGELVYYRLLAPNSFVVDFKRQADGTLTYYDGSIAGFVALDNSYNSVNFYQTGNGIVTDLHDLQLLPNGHALILGQDNVQMDMSAIVPGGSPTATVIGAVIQELDLAHFVVFEWRSWDHILLTDTTEALTGTLVDPVHVNAIEQDQDGNLLLSSRHLDEITKIDRQTGDMIWRLGGKNNQFTFVNDAYRFAHQHDIRRQTNGNITLYDDHNGGPYSRGIEYTIDEVGKTITQVHEFRNTPDTTSFALGNLQRLPNGNSLIGWGTSLNPVMNEYKPDGTRAFELSLQPPYLNYRSFRFPWHGYPSAAPTLVAQVQGNTTTLAYSWNGATEIASYKIYGGDAPYPTDLIATQSKIGFEDHTVLSNEHRYCYFRVLPVDNQGHDTKFSNEVYTHQACYNGKLFLPSIMN